MHFLDFIFPKQCVSCARFGKYICDQCLKKASYAPLVCPVCRRTTFAGKIHKNCLKEYEPDGAVAIWKYTGVVQRALKVLKYHYAFTIAEEIADRMSLELLKYKLPVTRPVLVPIPLHSKRKRIRGFNQAEEIGKLIVVSLKWSYRDDLLIRSKRSKPQALLRPFYRSRNIRGKFAVNAEKLAKIDKNASIILFDDVWTTGSTLFEATKVLKKAGVKHVWILTVARSS